MTASTAPVTARWTTMTGISIHQRSTLPTRQTSATIRSVVAVNMARSEMPRSRIGGDSLLGAIRRGRVAGRARASRDRGPWWASGAWRSGSPRVRLRLAEMLETGFHADLLFTF